MQQQIVRVEHCVSSMEKEQWKAVKKFHVMVMVELWWHTSKLCGTVMGGRRLSLNKEIV